MTKTIDKDLKPELEQYIVQFPDEKEINTTINALRQYVPTKQTRTTQFIQRFMKLINHAKTEVFFMGKLIGSSVSPCSSLAISSPWNKH